jgi:hypothetical protein
VRVDDLKTRLGESATRGQRPGAQTVTRQGSLAACHSRGRLATASEKAEAGKTNKAAAVIYCRVPASERAQTNPSASFLRPESSQYLRDFNDWKASVDEWA